MDGETCWTLVRSAAEGDPAARSHVAGAYLPAVRAYFVARWGGSPLAADVEDATQEVFLDLLRPGGALERVEPGRPGGFRAFLFGVTRNVALRVERRRARRGAREEEAPLDTFAGDEESLSGIFDRAWARALVRAAAARQAEAARSEGPAALRRVELLQLRFADDLPIREIALRWNVEAAWLHHQYAQARAEFERALREEIARHHPGAPEEVEREWRALVQALGAGA